MKFFTSVAIVVASLPLLSTASPIRPDLYHALPPARRQTASYSVVPVDGGSSSSAAAATTVTEPAATLPPTTKVEVSTLLSTIVVTQAPAITPTSVVITSTSTAEITIIDTEIPAATTVLSTVLPPALAPSPFFISTTTFTQLPTGAPTSTPTLPTLENYTVTVTDFPSSTPYDDGMWHTTYYYGVPFSPTESSTSTAEVSTTAPSSTTPPQLDVTLYNSTTTNCTIPTANSTTPLTTNYTISVTSSSATRRLRFAR